MKKTKQPQQKVEYLPHTVKTITNLSPQNIKKLNKKQLLDIAQFGAKQSNYRRTRAIKTFESREIPLPTAYKEWSRIEEKATMLKGTPKGVQSYRYIDFSVNSKMTLNQLRAQFHYIQSFLKSKTSITRGWDKQLVDFRSKISENIEQITGKKVRLLKTSKTKYNQLWEIYNKIDISQYGSYNSTQIQAMIYNELEERDISNRSRMRLNEDIVEIDTDEILDEIIERLTSDYEKRKGEDDDNSEPFGLGSND